MPRSRRKTHLQNNKWPKVLPNGDVFYAYKFGSDYWAYIQRISHHGLKWRKCSRARQSELRSRRRGPALKRPSPETELTHFPLSETLETKAEFTATEWRSYDLRPVANDYILVCEERVVEDDFVLVDAVYFEPVVENLQLACTASRYERALAQSFADRELAQLEQKWDVGGLRS